MIDRTTKILLAVIAIGLWANLAAPIFYPRPAIADNVSEVVHDLHGMPKYQNLLKRVAQEAE